MAKRNKTDQEINADIERMENEGGAVVQRADEAGRLVTYRGGHPLIRRWGYAFELSKPKAVAAGVAALLVAQGDFEDAASTPPAGVPDLPPAA